VFPAGFLVSNNGNVVINSDADQIVIATRKDDEISYISGAIENPFIRDKTLTVLDGGTEAF
jgi:ribose 5-phosphate isomerase